MSKRLRPYETCDHSSDHEHRSSSAIKMEMPCEGIDWPLWETWTTAIHGLPATPLLVPAYAVGPPRKDTPRVGSERGGVTHRAACVRRSARTSRRHGRGGGTLWRPRGHRIQRASDQSSVPGESWLWDWQVNLHSRGVGRRYLGRWPCEGRPARSTVPGSRDDTSPTGQRRNIAGPSPRR